MNIENIGQIELVFSYAKVICKDLAELPVLLLAGYNSFINFAEYSQWHIASGPNEINQKIFYLLSEKNVLISLESCFLFVCNMHLSQTVDTIFRKTWQFVNSKPHIGILFWFLYVLLLISLQVHSDTNISF